MSFLRHREIYQVAKGWRGRNRGRARAVRLDESPVGYSLAGCSPAEPASASPTGGTLQQWRGALQLAIRCFPFTTFSRGLTLGAHPNPFHRECQHMPQLSHFESTNETVKTVSFSICRF
jgi:hypothetical protein